MQEISLPTVNAELPGERYSFICLAATIGNTSSLNSTDVIGGDDLCLGVSPGPGNAPKDPLPLQLKSRQRNIASGYSLLKARWNIDYRPNGTVSFSVTPSMCMRRHTFKAFDVYLQYGCSGPLATFNTTLFLDTPDRTAVLFHSATGMCVTAMKCNLKRICTGPTGKKTCDNYCAKSVYNVAPVGSLARGSYVKLWPCYFSHNGNPLDKHAQVFRNRLDCAPGCIPLMQGDGTCQIPCANDLCALDNGDCVSAAPTVPTFAPTTGPTTLPTFSPTTAPSRNPTFEPSVSPTQGPTASPSRNPTLSPTHGPTPLPTFGPTTSPVRSPTLSPSESPSFVPSLSPAINGTIPLLAAVSSSGGLEIWAIVLIVLACFLCCLCSLCMWFAFWKREREREEEKKKKDVEEGFVVVESVRSETAHSPETRPAPQPVEVETLPPNPEVIADEPKTEPKEESPAEKRRPPPLPTNSEPSAKRIPTGEFKINQEAEAVKREVFDVHVVSGEDPRAFLKKPAIERKSSRSSVLSEIKRRGGPPAVPPPLPPVEEKGRSESQDIL